MEIDKVKEVKPSIPSIDDVSKAALEVGEGEADQDLSREQFELERESRRVEIEHNKKEFHPILRAKIVTISVALIYVISLAVSLMVFMWTVDSRPHNPAVILACITGGYLSIFGVLAILFKGLFGNKEKREDANFSAATMLQTLAETIKILRK